MTLKRRSGLTSLRTYVPLIFIVFFVSAKSQPIDPLNLADSLFSIKAYQPAITEYKRFLFFQGHDDSSAHVYSQIGKCYRNLFDWDKAAESFRNAIDRASNDSLRSEYKIALGVVHISSGDYSSAEMSLLGLASFSKIPAIRARAAFFLSLNYIYRHKWKEAKQYLEENFPISDSSANSELRQLLEKAANTKYKSPALAEWLSTFIPGLGQIYAGKPLSALNAMAINAGTGYLLFDTIDKHPSFIEIFSYGSLFHRYWAGNRNNAAQYVRESNEKKDKKLEMELLQVIDKMMD